MTLLEEPEAQKFIKDKITEVKHQRSETYQALTPIVQEKGIFIKESQANFFLLRWKSQEQCQAAYQHLIQSGILVRNISKGPGLTGCLRASLGLAEENQALIKALAGAK